MEKPLLSLKPSIVNGWIPLFFKNLLYALIAGVMLYFVAYGLKSFGLIDFSTNLWVGLIALAILVIPTGLKLVILSNTHYRFYHTHVESEFRMIAVKKHSIPYNQIADIALKISLWDRLTGAGNIVLHTAEEKHPSMVLFYIKKPEKVEKMIYRMLHRK